MKRIIFLSTLLCCISLNIWAACSVNLNMDGNLITNLGTPTSDNDAATKVYIDNLLSTLTSSDVGDIMAEYGTITYGGRTWLDRNLGARRVAQSLTDSEGYGDLYQWGRTADGHEYRSSGITGTRVDVPDHGLFITGSNNWRSVQNDDLWNDSGTGVNNVCPNGYRLPTNSEFTALENLHTPADFSDKIRSPLSGYRSMDDGSVSQEDTNGFYWTSDIDVTRSKYVEIYSSGVRFFSNHRAYGFSVRCIKN